MADYDFTSLSPHDFEVMCRDLLQEELSVRLQSYKVGRDKGIDLRHAYSDGTDLIVQCKHFARSSFAALYSKLRDSEVPKVVALAPERYIVATSLGLSPSNVDSIRSLFEPYCRSTDDVLGRDDLNNLLRKHPAVERHNFKLWLTSQAVLEKIIHSAVFVQSEFDEQEIRRKMAIYVESAAVGKAFTILDEHHCCIISGIPGIGKTTLAQILLVHFLSEGWELISIQEGIEEAINVFKPDPKVKQVFFYDDFLGQITLGGKLQKNEDRRILQLMKAVANTNGKRFILTTREYILAQAREQYEVLSRADFSISTCVLELDDYSPLDKAKILANHLYFSDVPQDHIDELLRDQQYLMIIQHPNYNPRLVEWMTDKLQTSQLEAQGYFDAFMETLANPVKIWRHAFEHQISESSRHLLLTLGTLGRICVLADLESAFLPFYSTRASKFNFSTKPSDLKKSLEELEGTFVRIGRSARGPVVAFHNPSIMDFVARHCKDASDDVDDLLMSFVFFEQFEQLMVLFSANLEGQELDEMLRCHSDSVQHAIESTLMSNAPMSVDGVAIFADSDVHHVSENRTRVCRRLQVVWDLATKHASSEIRRITVEHIGAVMHDLAGSGELKTDLIVLLHFVESEDWIEDSTIQKWLLSAKRYLSGTPDSMDEAEAVAAWADEHANIYSEEEQEELADTIIQFVSSEIDRSIEEESDPDELDAMIGCLEELGPNVRYGFEHEIGNLNEAAEEIRRQPRWDEEDQSDWGGPPTGTSPTGESIDSVFDALRE